MREPRFWKSNNLFSTLLLPLSFLYRFISYISEITSFSPYVSKKVIICVGNLTVGGNGKTPTVCFLARYLQDLGFSVVIASRGYKGKERNTKKVQPEDDPVLVGDEPLILVNFATCYIGKDKKKLISTIETLEDPDIIIFDDGLQNYSFKKDCEIIVIDGLKGFSNHKIFPAGPLRENVNDRLKTSHNVIFIGEDKTGIKNSIQQTSKIVQAYFKPVNKKMHLSPRYIAFAGIGNPDKFFDTLKQNEYNLVETVSYPDHYYYTAKDLDFLSHLAQMKKAKLITTVKDAVKLPLKFKTNVDILEIDLVIDNNGFFENILSIIKKHSEL